MLYCPNQFSVPASYVSFRLIGYLLAASNGPVIRTRHTEAFHVANRCDILTEPCFKEIFSRSYWHFLQHL